MSPELSTPNVIPEIDGLTLDWVQEHLKCEVRAICQHHDGNVACELHFTTSAPGFNPHLLRHHINDLANATGRDRLATLLTRSYNHVPWDDVMEYVGELTLNHLRKPPKLDTTFDFTDAKPPQFCLWPFIVQHENNMLFAPGSGGKSALALFWLILLEAQIKENPFNWIVREEPVNILYLDWERSLNTHLYRMRGLLNGLELPSACPDAPLNYKRLNAPLFQTIRQAQSLINDSHASIVIYDSCGMAAGGDMNATEPAIRFFGAAGALQAYDGKPLTNLLISHTSKDPNTSKKTPYGNAYWGNECSSIWEIIPSENQEHNLHSITLHNFKHNDYSWQPDIGVKITFTNEGIIYSPCNAQSRTEIGQGHDRRIYDVLDKPMSPLEISKLSGIAGNIVSAILTRLAKDGFVRNIQRGLWERGKVWTGDDDIV